jgi:nascent polypeptide-associated complex subunit alpha
MFPGFNPKKMGSIMKQMGINQEEIPASRVIIEKPDNSKIIIENPSVIKVNMQGQDSFQISGDVMEEEALSRVSEEDVKTVMEKTGCTEQEAIQALEETGDLAEAILKFS